MPSAGIIIAKIVLLLGCAVCLAGAAAVIADLRDDATSLTMYQGILQGKGLFSENQGKNKHKTLTLKLSGSNNGYHISMNAGDVNSMVAAGDTLQVYTKKSMHFWGAFVSGPGYFWTTYNPNEVFHIVKGNNIILDFEAHRQRLKSMVWLFPFFAVVFFGLYQFFRIKAKPPFEKEANQAA